MDFVTTAINYTNGEPHIGHCYEAILADVIVRYKKLFKVNEVFFQTGTDEHGQKIEEKAKKEGKLPIELCNFYVNLFKLMNEKMQIDYDYFIRTTDTLHKEEVIRLFKILEKQDDIYLGTYTGWYNVREEIFVTESDAKLSNYLDSISKQSLQKISEESYFFRLSKYLPDVLKFLNSTPDFILPNYHQKAICARLKEYIESQENQDLSISRTKISWGIPIPTDKEHCLYVWMDALFNYHTGPLTKLGNSPFSTNDNGSTNNNSSNSSDSSDSSSNTSEIIHIIGKDILWFHAVIWLSFLKALNFNFPTKIYVHDFIVDRSGQKMSKSIGNVVDPTVLLEKYGKNALRFYLIKKTCLASDIKFCEESLKQCLSAELAAKLGNLVNRVLCMTDKYCFGKVPAHPNKEGVTQVDDNVEKEEPFNAVQLYDKIRFAFSEYRLSDIVEILQESIHLTNQHINKTEIWRIKDELLLKKAVFQMRLYLEAILIIAQLFEPILPEISSNIFKALNIEIEAGKVVNKEIFWNQLTESAEIEKKLILFPLK